MLTQISCECFGDKKPIKFYEGLNVIQGLSGNSIGKSNMLKIIDYAFGGKYYADSNDDVIQNVGNHDIFFIHEFGNQKCFFKRNAKNSKKVSKCNSDFLELQEVTLDEFNKELLQLYKLENLQVSFRDIVSLYSRVWNKPNKDVARPLYGYSSQSLNDAIMKFIKLFNEYAPIGELVQQKEYLLKREKTIKSAVTYDIVSLPKTKKDFSRQISRLETINNEICQLQANITIASPANAARVSSMVQEQFDIRDMLISKQNRLIRERNRLKRNLQGTQKVAPQDFAQLKKYFPAVNVEKLYSVQFFHSNIQAILSDDLEKEIHNLENDLQMLSHQIADNEACIEERTHLPTRATEALSQLIKLIGEKERLEKEIELYNDKVASVADKKIITEKLNLELKEIVAKIEKHVNKAIVLLSASIKSSNNKPPELSLGITEYTYGVSDNTGTGKAYTDLLLFDLAVLSLTELPILIHDSFLFNNIDNKTICSFIKIYNSFTNKQIFISLDRYLGDEDGETKDILTKSMRKNLSETSQLFGIDWRK